MFLINSRLSLFTAATRVAPLLPKLRGHFAEFLNKSYPVHLRIFSSSTCVGLRYGHLSHLAAFLASVNSPTSLLVFSPHRAPALILRTSRSTGLNACPHISISAVRLSSCVPASYNLRWYRNIYRLCIIYAFRPQLSSRLTLGGRTFPRKPLTFDGGVSRSACATYAGILSCMQSTAPFDTASARIHCSSTDALACIPKLRCQVLAPVIFGASSLDQ